MWAIPIITCISYLTFFTTSWVIRGIEHGFWQWSITRSHILIGVKTVPEVENVIYVAFLCIGICIFFLYYRFADVLRKYTWMERLVMGINYTFSLYILFTPHWNIFKIDHIDPPVFFMCLIIGIIAGKNPNVSPIVFETIMSLGFLRWISSSFIELDIGKRMYYSVDNVLRYGVGRMLFPIALGCMIIARRRSEVLQRLTRGLTKSTISLYLLGIILLTLLYLLTKIAHPSDMFFTMLPAYHALHGGTLLVSVMSQYGLLYLMPWIAFFALFPQVPVSSQVGAVFTVFLLCCYFLIFMRTVGMIIHSRILFVLTVLASYYFTILVRYTPISDMVSLVSTPAFTPLRFGVFLFPLWFLVRYRQTNNHSFIYGFIVCSAVLFFYSFEIGVGLLASAIITIILTALRTEMPYGFLIRCFGILVAASALCVTVITVYTVWSAGVLPDYTYYWYIATLFGSGFLTTPMNGSTVGMLPITVTGIALFIGCASFFGKQKQNNGIIFCYLALIQLAMFPYYTGRSMNQTIYSISLPFILLCALLVEHGISIVRKNRSRIIVWTTIFVCSMVLVTGAVRGAAFSMNTVFRAHDIIPEAAGFIRNAFTRWGIRDSREYIYLKEELPKGCPLIAFDKKEFELFSSLDVPPAFQYSFVYGFITTKEQIDALVPHRDAEEICIFVSDDFLKKKDEFSFGAYRYFFNRFGASIRQLSRDDKNGFTLFVLPTNAFHTF